MAQAPLKAGSKELSYTNLYLIHEFTSLFSPEGDSCRLGLHTEACLCGHQCFSAVAQATAKIRPRPAQVLFLMKELHRTTKAIAQMNADWKVEKSQYAEFNVPTCGNIPVCQLCRERKPLWNSHAWWPEFDMFGSIPWCSFPWHELLAGAKELLYSVNLIREFTSLFSPKVIYTGLPRNAFPRK